MKRSTSRWATAMAAAALIALPAASYAQTPTSQQPQYPTQGTAPKASQTGAESPAEHVRAAKQAASSIQANTLPASARPKFQQLRTHLNNLERDVAKGESASSGASASAKSGKPANWGSEVAAIDKILTELIGPDTGSAASSGSMTSGTAGSATGTAGKSPATIDEATKQQLRSVREHITALATSMSGTPKTEPSPSAAAPSPSETPNATPSPAAPSTTAPSATPSSPSTTPSPEPSATPPPSANQQTTPAGAQPPAAQGQVNREAAKQHLSEARESLSQIAAMPEAAKLQGEQRNQVSQLIANFNELITTQSDWKAAYGKLDATLSALLGPSNAPPSPAGTTGTTATPETAGTTGSATGLEPAIRAKLEEFRTHMKAFEQAAGGQTASNSPSMSPSVSTGSTSSPAAPSPSQPTPSPTTPPASPTPAEPAPSPAAPSNPTPNPTPSATPAPTGSAGVAGATGTTGAASPAATDAAASSEANKHLDAIADILSKAKDGKLDKEQTEQIKMHVDELRQLLKK